MSVLRWAQVMTRMRIIAYCVMPNHWHLMLWSAEERDVTCFAFLLTSVHARSWRARRGTTGQGHVYQERYKVVLVQDGAHYFDMARYVERNALRANLVLRAEDWPWGSAAQRAGRGEHPVPALSEGPIAFPPDWLERVNVPRTAAEDEALRRAITLSAPYGTDEWCREISATMQSLRTRREPAAER